MVAVRKWSEKRRDLPHLRELSRQKRVWGCSLRAVLMVSEHPDSPGHRSGGHTRPGAECGTDR